ncbi:hypothetical protein EYB26_009286 [Talaromyces marneffei]|uniref:uncharacterized protein n=1 Tax=Talaromyces marneffei TaxID=37727 RepID=UPI0012A8E0FB|nr:uncharacterized protein EYB26_009286 [Talaromyces marneffei]QGA21575.1 hypothetical protein EYB26_009286 [Talaromyces marneffei]
MSDPDQYTVGWICALETEYVAARAFLDTKHTRPEKLSPNDNNHYTLGEIGGHKVVIAVVPDREYGTSSAAEVARDMLHSFPNIRFGLMVGIGGGVPLKHDIRLGDIIVSSPRNGHGGLLQYDFGKELQGKEFHQTGFLNQPPPILRTAVAGLQAQYEEEGHQLKERIQSLLEGNKRLKRKYERPPFESDRLYESGVVKDALFRDKIATSQDVLCFEMEAAGLINHFPCLVIRGVCDYADSHKSKEWQGYAAMAAAAYARDLLNQIVPQRVDSERRATDALNDIKNCLENVSGTVDSIRSMTSGVAKNIENIARGIQLDELPIAEGAEFGTYVDQHEEECFQGTREDLLHKVGEWATLPKGKCIFWLNGLAGTGKSTISRTVARNFQKQGLLGASFFFKRGEGDRGNATRFFPTIARQLFAGIPEVRDAILQVIKDHPRISAKPLKEQFDRLIKQPLADLYQLKGQRPPLVIVIDALDECEGENDIRVIIQQLPRSVCLRFFITSRPELPVRLGFQTVENSYQDLILHEISETVIEHDISLFLKYKLARIREQRDLCLDWPGKPNFTDLLSMSIPLFIFAATICRQFEDYNLDPEQSLREILEYQNEESRLEKTYLPVLMRLVSRYDGKRQIQVVQDIREVLGIIILLEVPLPVVPLSNLTGITINTIKSRLGSVHSVVHIPNNNERPIRIFHLSFRDFLLDSSTREKTPFWVDEKEMSIKLSNYCLSVMKNRLKKNICNLPSHGIQRRDIDAQLISQHLSPELQYACRYWIHHITKILDVIIQVGHVYAFLQVHFLHWMEVMCTLGLVSEVIGGINILKSTLQDDDNLQISEFLDDAQRFILRNSHIADIAPLQIYTSGLIFAPRDSIIRQAFESDRPSWMHYWPNQDEGWGPDLQTLEGHSGSVVSVAFSPNGRLIASSSYDGTIKLWDPDTGALKHTLESHKERVESIAFSPNGRLLVSGSYDGTIKLWDSDTGALKYTVDDPHGRSFFEINNPNGATFVHHTGPPPISSVAFSPDGELLASGANDGSVKFWDPATGALERILQTKSRELHRVDSVCFSPDGRLLAAGSSDGTIKLWDPVTGVLNHTMWDYSNKGAVFRMAFSPDARLLASCHIDGSNGLWDPVTGALKNILGLSGHSVCFAPDGGLLAIGYDISIELWDPFTCTLKYILEPLSYLVLSVAFSPDSRLLASADGNSIKLWDLDMGAPEPILNAHADMVYSVAFSPDGQLLASCSRDRTIKLWETSTGALKHTLNALEGQLEWSTLVIFSHDNRLLASGVSEGTVRLWDPATGILKHTLKGPSADLRMRSSVTSLAFSPNGQMLAAGTNNHIIDIWDLTTGTVKHSLELHVRAVGSITFSPNSQLLAIGSRYEINLWDMATGTLKHTVEENRALQSIAFLPDSKLLVSGSTAHIKFWDYTTGALEHIIDAFLYWDSDVDPSKDIYYLSTKLQCFTAQDWRKSFLPDFVHVINKPSLHGNQWVANRGQRELWLPPGYRSSEGLGVSTVKDGALAIGCENGRVQVITFSN